jgi:hypothetical protein
MDLLTDGRSQEATFATVLVGPDEDRFVVHEEVLIHHSQFFRAALTGGFKEAKEKTVRLRDVNPHIFEFFVHWLYYQQFPCQENKVDPELVARREEEELDHRLTQMYTFANSHCIQSLERQIFDAYFDASCNDTMLPADKTIDLAFTMLNPDSALCRLIVDLYCYLEDATTLSYTSAKEWNALFMFCAWQRYKKLVHSNNPPGTCKLRYKLQLCDYHNHQTDAEKKACKGAHTVQ